MPGAEDEQRLDAIGQALYEDDPRFHSAIKSGRPRAPKEYRRQVALLLLLIVVPLGLGFAAVAMTSWIVFLVAILVSGVSGVLVIRGSPDRLCRRRRRA